MNYFLTLNAAATDHPVSLAEAKLHLRQDGDDEENLIEALIAAATSAVEEETGRALITQTWDVAVSPPAGKVSIPLAPVASISAMNYYDSDDVSQSLTVGDFYLFKDNNRASVCPKDNIDWPTMKDRPDALTITFIAGYGDETAVPQPLKQAILMLVAHWYENREAVGRRMNNLPLAFQHLLAQYRLGWIK